jgi:chromate transporter
MMEDEVVRKRGWLTREAFLDYLGATNLIPGPNSTELAIHVGHVRAGWPGLLVAGTAFIVPAAILSALAAMAYGRGGALPVGGALLYGIKPVVIAVVLQALWGLGRTALRGPLLVAVAIASAAAVATGVHELLVLGIAAAIAMAPGMRRRGMAVGAAVAACVSVPLVAAAAAATTAGQDVTLSRLFVVFARIGSVLFGSGYVLLAFLRADLVERLGWLTSQQLLDATAAGQITPGPVFSTATFIGYLLAGPRGAAVATLGIFLPAFVFVAITAPFVPRLRRSRVLSRALDGVNAASFALMAVVSWQLARSAVIDVTTIAIAAAAFVALVHYRVNSAWLVLGGAIAGWLRLVLR